MEVVRGIDVDPDRSDNECRSWEQLEREANVKGMLRIAMLLAVVMTSASAKEVGGQRPAVRWYLVHQALSEQSNSLNIGDEAQTVSLRGGWSCQIGPTSKNLPLYEARQTLCANGKSVFEFSVQCEPSRPKDRTQIRFKDAAGQFIDFIEVGCELTQ